MKLSQNFTKTIREAPADETAKNAQLLIRAGYVHKTMAGVYSYLPLGLRMINKIENIVRKNLDAIGGQEILMNSLHPKEWWDKTDRWNTVDVLFKIQSQTDKEYALAPTHEEQITPILKQYINSWKDLPDYSPKLGQFPLCVYQIQTKFRDELRSKSGVMRGREFRMKDMYDVHTNKESQSAYFQLVTETYHKIYNQLGLKSYAVDASGGSFSDKFSREFQVICKAGEDKIAYSESTGFSCNVEILEDIQKNWANLNYGYDYPTDIKIAVSAEVGNIFDLGQKWIKAFDVNYVDTNNQKAYPYMGCHGIGTSRTMGVIAEIYSDEKGLKLPAQVAPFEIHLITGINEKDDAEINAKILDIANQIYSGELKLIKTPRGKYILLDMTNTTQLLQLAKEDSTFDLSQLSKSDEILWDDRGGKTSIGEKLKDADLIGCPIQIVVSKKSLENGGLEVIVRENGESIMMKIAL
jgi:prolyl-tRNA synthetase